MNKKATMKREYKLLIRDNKTKEADKVLEAIWELSGLDKHIDRSNIMAKANVKKDVKKVAEKKYTREELQSRSFNELKVIGAKFGTTDRSKKNLIKEILALQ